jgi:beta-glucosidase
MGWPITPEGLYDLLHRISVQWPEVEDISITENGAAFDDEVVDGAVLDEARVNYLLSHIESVGRAIRSGAPVSSYHAWSFLDNFEWAEGYAKRFGLVHVNYETQERTFKQSAKVYGSIISSHGDLESKLEVQHR